MAIPKDRSKIRTNIPRSKLNEVLEAIEAEKVTLVPGSYSLYADSGGWQITFKGSRFAVEEISEEVTSVQLIQTQ